MAGGLRIESSGGKVRLAVVDLTTIEQLKSLHTKALGAAPDDAHEIISNLLRHATVLVAGHTQAPEAFRKVLERHVTYHTEVLARVTTTQLADISSGFQVSRKDAAAETIVRQCVGEMLSHIAAGYDCELAILDPPDSIHDDRNNPLYKILPRSVFTLRTEAAFNLIAPWFHRSIELPGDVCEVGCFQGTMALKFAFALKALGKAKTVYAFDTFEGFTTTDPEGGRLGIGFYAENDNAFEELSRWSNVLPIRPVKGDATLTSAQIKAPLSFLWMDLDYGSLMRPTFENLWPWITAETIIGVDDVGRIDGAGRPVTPGVEPWIDELVAAGRLLELERYPGAFIRFYRAKK